MVLPAHAGMIRSVHDPELTYPVLPAHAGIIRVLKSLRVGTGSAPRSRGDDPRAFLGVSGKPQCSPLTRG